MICMCGVLNVWLNILCSCSVLMFGCLCVGRLDDWLMIYFGRC